MCQCEQRKFISKIKPLLAAGDDLVAAIQKAEWGTVRHPTMHMEQAMAVWEDSTCHLRPKKAE